MRVVLLLCSFTALLVAVVVTPSSAALRLSEILAGPARDWDGSGAFSSRDDEWVEVRNESGAPLDLTGWFLTDGDSIPRFAFAGTLAGGARQVVYGKTSVDWERATGFPVFGLSLANTGDSVLLWQITGSDTALVDSYTYKSHEAASDRSVARDHDDGAWTVFDALNPYTGTTPPLGSGCSPTPAASNVCDITPVEPVTWGRVKAIYR